MRVIAGAILLGAAAVSPAALPAAVSLFGCAQPSCEAVSPDACQPIAAPLPTDGTCTAGVGGAWFSAAADGASLTVRGFATGECDGAVVWGEVHGLVVADGVAGCQPVRGSRGGGAYVTNYSGRAAPAQAAAPPALPPPLPRARAADSSPLVNLYSCGRPDCQTVPPNDVCGVVIAYLPTNNTCTWNNGAYCFTASLDANGELAATGYRWTGSCACGASPSWGQVSGVAVGGVAGCQPVLGGYGGGAYATWSTDE